MKNIIFIGTFLFLVGCHTSTETEVGDTEENQKNSIETVLVNEIENEDFKLIVQGEKSNFSVDETIVITAELHYIGSDDEIEVYSNASLLEYSIQNEAGTFQLESVGEDSHHTFVINKDEPLVEIIELDRNDDSFGNLLESMDAGSYELLIRASYGTEDILDKKCLETELNFTIFE